MTYCFKNYNNTYFPAKRLPFNYLIFLALAVISCEKPHIAEAPSDSTLTINLETQSTKAYATDNEAGSIASLDIFIFNEDGNLDLSHSCTAEELGAKKAVLNLKTGQKTIFVLANLNGSALSAARNCYTLNTLKNVALNMDANVASGKCQALMSGSSVVNLTTAGISTTVELRRYLSRVVLSSVNNSLPAPYGSIKLKRAYLCNAVGNQNIGSTAAASVWHNMDGTKNHSSASDVILSASDSYCPTLLFSDLGGEELANTASKSYIISSKASKTFYAYPNSKTNISTGFSSSFVPSASVLMLVAEIKGTEYYYPVALKNGLIANTENAVSLTILGLGNKASDPFRKIEKANLSASVTIANWTEGTAITEVI